MLPTFLLILLVIFKSYKTVVFYREMWHTVPIPSYALVTCPKKTGNVAHCAILNSLVLKRKPGNTKENNEFSWTRCQFSSRSYSIVPESYTIHFINRQCLLHFLCILARSPTCHHPAAKITLMSPHPHPFSYFLRRSNSYLQRQICP